MSESTLHVCWTIDCESSHPAVADVALGRNAMVGFADLLAGVGWKGSFFMIPEELKDLGDLASGLQYQGHEIGIHLHPAASGRVSDYLGVYSREEQIEIIAAGVDVFKDRVAVLPTSCRPGYCSANDLSFPAMETCGIKQTSASMPGRRMTKLASVWAGAPLFAHFAHRHNRLLKGRMDLVEIPISVDWESMIWGGAHPVDLRVELTDAKNHSFLIEKIIRRQVEDKVPFKAIVILTHNTFRYADRHDFRRETMVGMIDAIRRSAESCGLNIRGCSIATAAQNFRIVSGRSADACTPKAQTAD